MKRKEIILIVCLLLGVFSVSVKAAPSPFKQLNKSALLDKISNSSLLDDIRWVENKGQLSVANSLSPRFCESIRYYAKTSWGYLLILNDNSLVLNFLKPTQYRKGDTYVLIKQPDWEDRAKTLGLSGKNLIKLKDTGYIKDKTLEVYLSPAYQGPLDGFRQSFRSYNLYLSVNAERPMKIEPAGERVEKQSYIKGNDPSKWTGSLRTYNEMWVYFEKGIIFRFYSKGNIVKKEIIVPEGVSLDEVHLTYTSKEPFELSVKDRQLVMSFEGYEFIERKPRSYILDAQGERKEIEATYHLSKAKLLSLDRIFGVKEAQAANVFNRSFQIKSEWDEKGVFVFDPLLYSTYVGGDGSHPIYPQETSNSIALGSGNYVYITGSTISDTFPTTEGAYDDTANGAQYISHEVIICKLDPQLSSLIASTYLGGSESNFAWTLSLDSANNVYVGGLTSSDDFPITTGAYDETYNGGYDSFISKFNSDLSVLSASTYLGGKEFDSISHLILDSANNVYITGKTRSNKYPVTAGAYDRRLGSRHYYDVIISKLDSDLSSLIASTYLGGTGIDEGESLSLDSANNVYVTGKTNSTNFPTTPGAYDDTYHGGYDGFISKFNSDLSVLSASTYFGGGDNDYSYDIELDSGSNVYITGSTGSSDFPTTSGGYNGYSDVFISKLSSDLGTLGASTYLGGSDNDYSYDIELDSGSNVYITGSTGSSDFPTTSGAYDTFHNGYADVFISKLTSDLVTLGASTYLGGESDDEASSLILDSGNNVYVTGTTYSNSSLDFPFPVTEGAYQEDFAGGYTDLFISILDSDLSE